MKSGFSHTLALLRKERGLTQKSVAGELGISQALLSHYENGVREPGLEFVVAAADYYDVSADFLLGRTMARDGVDIDIDALYDESEARDNTLKSGAMALLSKKILVNTIGLLFDLLGRSGARAAIRGAFGYIGTAVYRASRRVCKAASPAPAAFMRVPDARFEGGSDAYMKLCEMRFSESVGEAARALPPVSDDMLKREYPQLAPAFLSLFHSTGQEVLKLCARGDEESE